tara:strand:- start:4381 stop:5976 length:1596 start_codon:yes stop_codon:yes gene_type:complete
MAFELFGFEIGKKKKKEADSFVIPESEDGSITLEGAGGSIAFGMTFDAEAKNEHDLINHYREMASQPEVDYAIDDILNEAIVTDESKPAVTIRLDNLDTTVGIKNKIRAEFENVLQLLDFQNSGYEIFRKWYVDGRLYYHMMVDETRGKNGIQELRWIDPTTIKKVKQLGKKKKKNIDIVKTDDEFFIYRPKMRMPGQVASAPYMPASSTTQIKVHKDSIVYVTSGILNQSRSLVLSNLHKSIKPMNQLRMIEDAVVIYRLSRAPERRVFYIDVGNLPKMKAEQYLKNIMTKYKNKLTYNATTGEVQDSKNHMSMLEDYWLPRREGGRGTEITTLPGGQSLGEIEDIQYFRRKLYKSLNVPISRLETDGNNFNLGRTAEITRDELKFSKFVARLRTRFSTLFDEVLKTQLVLKKVITVDDWEDFKEDINYDFLRDSHFAELKDSELMKDRLENLQQIDDAGEYMGKYFSKEWVRKNVLRMDEFDIKNMDKQIEKEKAAEDDEMGGEFDTDAGDEPTDQEPDAEEEKIRRIL